LFLPDEDTYTAADRDGVASEDESSFTDIITISTPPRECY